LSKESIKLNLKYITFDEQENLDIPFSSFVCSTFKLRIYFQSRRTPLQLRERPSHDLDIIFLCLGKRSTKGQLYGDHNADSNQQLNHTS